MRYQEVVPITRDQAEAAFATGNPTRVCDALVRITYHDPDWRWVHDWCVRLVRHSHPAIRGCAATCFGHLARIHRVGELKTVVPILEELLEDPEVAGRAGDALEDIRMFLPDE